jgi:hypothetical protein
MDTSHADLVGALHFWHFSLNAYRSGKSFEQKLRENEARTLCPVCFMAFEIIKQMLRCSCVQHSATVFRPRPIFLDSN